MTQTSAYPARSSDAAAANSRPSTLLRSGLARLQPWSDWIVLIITAAALYPMFGRSSDMAPFYSTAARCILRGEPLLNCLPPYPYQPALAIFFIPLAFLPAVLQRLIWYVIFVGCLVLAVRLTEAIAERLYPGSTRGQNLFWLRTIMLVTCGKHFLDVITYASHDPLSLALIMFATWALFNGREAVGGLWLAVAAAIRASPLIYLPYLVLKRRWLACVVFIVAFLAVSLIPDVIGALRGGHTGHFTGWLRQVVGPALVPGTSSNLVFWDIWNGANLYNQSLRGLINRFATGPVFGLTPTMILIVVDGIFAAIVGVLLLMSPRRREYVAIDTAVLLIAMLALSPMTSRYHYIFVLPAVILATAATIADPRLRTLGTYVLAASFLLRAGTSNDLVGGRITDFAYSYGFMPLGAIALYIIFGAILWAWHPPGLSAADDKAEAATARTPSDKMAHVAGINPAVPAECA
ncbi:MAG: glycosyltransferase 87 family protein [Betaproteobacteria bacterium]